MAKDAIVDQGIITSEMRSKVNVIKEHMTVDTKTGVISTNDLTIEKILPDGMTVKDVKNVVNAITDYGVASRVAFSEVALDTLKSNSDLDRISGNVPVMKGVVYGHTMDRFKSIPKPGTDEVIEKYGNARTTLGINVINNNRGTMKHVNAFFSEEAARVLSGKKK